MPDAKVLLQQLACLTPEVGLTALILLLIVADILLKREKRPIGFLALVGTLLVLAMALDAWRDFPATPVGGYNPGGPAVLFGGSIVHDLYGLFFKGLFLVAAVVAILLARPVVDRWKSGQGETYVLMLSCVLGMMFMATANDLLMMYLSLEFVSITSYILAGLRQKNRRSSEASLKYIIYGAAASGLMIYGMSYLYGLTGTLQVDAIGRSLSEQGAGVSGTLTLLISVLVMAGFGYKIAAAPFHMWCPDVYEGAPTPVTAFFSVGPKAAGFAMLTRYLAGVFQTHSPPPDAFRWDVLVAMIAVLTMAVGNLGALQQSNLKRLMAYSSIGHAGYLLLAFTVFEPANLASVLVYLVVYLLMNLGAFAVLVVLEESAGVETVEQCRGLGWRAPGLGALLTIFLVSLTGLPPTAGFIGKMLLFGRMIATGDTMSIALVVIAVLFSVISLYYYARIIAALFLGKPREEWTPPRAGPVLGGLLWALGFATLFYGLFPTGLGPLPGLLDMTTRAALSILPKI